MSIRDIAIRAITIYFALVTFITVAIMAMGLAFDGNARFGYDVFASPLVFAAAGLAPTVVMYSRHELSVREVLVRKVVQLALVEAAILGIAFASPAIHTNDAVTVAALAAAVAAIFLVVNAFTFAVDATSARKLTRNLERYQAQAETAE